MADKKVTELPTVTSPDPSDVIPIVGDVTTTPVNQKVALSSISWHLSATADETTAVITPTNYTHLPGDSRRYGATADGAADDSTEFAISESLTDLVPLPEGTNYNMGAIKPVKLVDGPGKVTLTGSSSSPIIGGFYVGFDVAGGSIVSAPEVWAEEANGETSTPGGIGTYFNVILAPGSNANDTANNNVWRSIVIGEGAGEYIEEWERVEAIGSGCMRFSEYAQRTTAIGTIALSWYGATSQQNLIDHYHDFFIQADPPGDPSWDFAGLETANPGIGTQIDAFSAYVTSTTNVSQTVAVGRDAGLHLVKGNANTYLGYQAGAHTFNGTDCVGVGAFALRDGVFSDNNTAVGTRAGADAQEGTTNTFLGHESGENFVNGNRNIFIGGSCAQGYDLSGSGGVYDNKFIVENFNNGHYLTGDNSIGNLFISHETDELADIEGEGSGFYNVVSPATTPATAGRFLGTATATVSTFNSYTGATTSRDHATFENTNGVVGTISTSGTATAYNVSSDGRIKTDLGPYQNALGEIMSVNIHDFHFTNDEEKTKQVGVFSQELEEVFPFAVTGDPDGMVDIGNVYNKSGEIVKEGVPKPNSDKIRWEKTGEKIKPQQVDYSKLVAPLLAAVQEQQGQISELQKQIKSLESKIKQ